MNKIPTMFVRDLKTFKVTSKCLTDGIGEIAICVNPNCPHPLHEINVEEYKAMLLAKVQEK